MTDMMRVVRRIASGSLGLALIDFQRSGYFEQLLAQPPEHLHSSRALDDAWDSVRADEALYARWAALEHCPDGSLGQGVWRFYRARGFTFPGRPDSAPPNLAQHDWVHVLADYGSAVESEIEVFGLISRCNDDPRAFSLLAMVLGTVRDRLPLRRGQGVLRVRPRPPLPRHRPHGGAPRRRHVPRGDARVRTSTTRTRGAAPTSSPLIGSSTPTGRSTRSAPSSASFPVRPGRWPRVRRRRGSAVASRRSSSSTDSGVAEAEGREYDSYGAEPA